MIKSTRGGGSIVCVWGGGDKGPKRGEATCRVLERGRSGGVEKRWLKVWGRIGGKGRGEVRVG